MFLPFPLTGGKWNTQMSEHIPITARHCSPSESTSAKDDIPPRFQSIIIHASGREKLSQGKYMPKDLPETRETVVPHILILVWYQNSYLAVDASVGLSSSPFSLSTSAAPLPSCPIYLSLPFLTSLMSASLGPFRLSLRISEDIILDFHASNDNWKRQHKDTKVWMWEDSPAVW